MSDMQLRRLLLGLAGLAAVIVLVGALLRQTASHCPDGKVAIAYKGNRWSCFSPGDPYATPSDMPGQQVP